MAHDDDTSNPGTGIVAGRTVRHLSPAELEERRRTEQCYNCDEKYVRGHNTRLFHLDIDDDEEELPAEETGEHPRISLLAIAGVRTRDTMQLAVRLGAVTLTAPFNSGSTYNFVTAPAASRSNLCFIPQNNISVTVTNGDWVPSLGVFCDAAFSIDNEAFRTDIFILPLNEYDMVLGTDWLATLGPILWDFGRHTMFFWRLSHRVRWRGVPGPAGPQLRVCSGVDTCELLDLLLAEFTDVFDTPTGLLPPRTRDHHIHLIRSIAPVAVQPYRYP